MMNDQSKELTNRILPDGEYEMNAVDLGKYGTSIEITRHGSDRKLCISEIEDDLTDVTMYDKDGTSIFQLTLFTGPAEEILKETFDTLIASCF